MTCWDLTESGSLSRPVRSFGMICHDSPNLSFSQPHAPSSPPSLSFAQSSSTFSCEAQSTMSETASLNLKSGPPFSAMN